LLTTSRSEAIAGLRDAASQLAAAELGGYANAVQWQLQHVLGVSAGDPWQGVSIVHPDRLAHTFAPLPVY